MKIGRKTRWALALGLLGFSCQKVCADGGVVRLRETRGPFVVTIFTPPELSQNTAADVSVLVQDASSSDAVLDASVHLDFTPASSVDRVADDPICGHPGGTTLATVAAHAQASNKLLYAASETFVASGPWRLEATITARGQSAVVDCNLPVGPPSGGLNQLLPWLIVPPIFIALYVVNQLLSRRYLRGGQGTIRFRIRSRIIKV